MSTVRHIIPQSSFIRIQTMCFAMLGIVSIVYFASMYRSKYLPQSSNFGTTLHAPSPEYEHLRRRVFSNTQEMWNYIQGKMDQMRQLMANADGDVKQLINTKLDEMLEMVGEHKRSLLNDMNDMRVMDGFEEWRQKEAKSLSDLVQRRLDDLQHPADCETAKKLVCHMKQFCGYGCQMHHVVYCFIMAYATERTLILPSNEWIYHSGGWQEVFQPLSTTCIDAKRPWYDVLSSRNIYFRNLKYLKSSSLNIPENLAPRLKRLHGDPFVWWIGQFLKYLLRWQPKTQTMIDNEMLKIGYQKPIVGVHIRRTDKLDREASFHTVDEYMRCVEDYYDQLDMVQKVDKRRVFLATDEPMVIDEARRYYPHYEIIADYDVARFASTDPFSYSSMNGIIRDIHLLSMSDHLVCTFSSNLCRVAFEIMQSQHPDASNRFRSLDDIYFFVGQNVHNREAVLSHLPLNHDEIPVEVGDLIRIAGNHWDGFSKGTNLRTNQTGLFPSFKVVDKVDTFSN